MGEKEQKEYKLKPGSVSLTELLYSIVVVIGSSVCFAAVCSSLEAVC